jgi:Transposase DDE domain group 1
MGSQCSAGKSSNVSRTARSLTRQSVAFWNAWFPEADSEAGGQVLHGRGTAEQWIKEGKSALKWTRLSCRRFKDNQVRLQLFALAYNLGSFLRQLALPRPVRTWSLTTLREKLIKIGAKVVHHARVVTFQLAEVAVPRELFAAILWRIGRLRAAPGLG